MTQYDGKNARCKEKKEDIFFIELCHEVSFIARYYYSTRSTNYEIISIIIHDTYIHMYIAKMIIHGTWYLVFTFNLQ